MFFLIAWPALLTNNKIGINKHNIFSTFVTIKAKIKVEIYLSSSVAVEFADVKMLRVVKSGTKRPPLDFL